MGIESDEHQLVRQRRAALELRERPEQRWQAPATGDLADEEEVGGRASQISLPQFLVASIAVGQWPEAVSRREPSAVTQAEEKPNGAY